MCARVCELCACMSVCPHVHIRASVCACMCVCIAVAVVEVQVLESGWECILAPPLSSCSDLKKPLRLSVPQFPYLQNGEKKLPSSCGCAEY